MLGGDLQVAADVVLGQLGHVFGRLLGEVHPDTRGDEDLVDARHFAALLASGRPAGRGRCPAACRSWDARTTAACTSASTSGRVQFIWYMLAVGPPMSETTPEKPGSWPIRRSSPSTDSGDRDWMIRPWCAVIEQNVQPPKQPRMIVTESLTTSKAGIFLPLVHRVRLARVGQAVDPVHVVLADRQGRRVADDRLAVVKLHEPPGVERVRLLVDDLGRPGELVLVGLDLFVRRQHDRVGRSDCDSLAPSA